MAKNWFEVDRAGLARILERRGKQLIVGELVQNAWDEAGVTRVDVSIAREPGSRDVEVSIEDDSPNGFHDLAHAYTLFAPSKKTADPTRRGRFNLGDKLVLALARRARLVSTTGGWTFDEDGRHGVRERREKGTKLTLTIPLTKEEQRACDDFARRLIPPDGIATFYNGAEIGGRKPIGTTTAVLKTEVENPETGNLSDSYRSTEVRVYQALGGPGDGWLYEMGIPVVATRDGFDVEVMQKIPLALDRTNVPPSFLSDARAAALNVTHQLLTPDVANSAWVRDALGSLDVSQDAVRSAFRARFTDKAVIYDPSDPEANKRATAAGYVVVHGSQLSESEWTAVRKAGAALPAGQVTPSKPKGIAETDVAQDTPRRRALALAVREIGHVLIGRKVHSSFVSSPDASVIATYAKEAGVMTFNVDKFPGNWLEAGIDASTLSTIVHELGHHYSGDHLSDAYHDALCELGARLALYVARNPSLLDLGAYLKIVNARAAHEIPVEPAPSALEAAS